MAYLGPPPSQKLATPTSQYFSGNGSATAFTLNRPVNVAEDLNVFVNNVAQQPGAGKSYTATGTTLTFDAAPDAGTNNVYVVYRGLAEPTTRLEHSSGQPLAATTGAFSGNVTIGGNLSVTGTGAGAAGITSASTSGTAINIDSSNRVTMGSQPRFFCGPSANATMSNSTSVVTQIAFDTETIDRGGDFASNTFTAPVTGDYLLHFQLRVDSVDIAALYYYFFILTSNRNYQNIMAPHWASDPEYNHFALTVVADMDANDTATVKYQQYQGTDNHATIIGADLRYSHFSGILLS